MERFTLGTRASKFNGKEIGKKKREKEERRNFLSFLIFSFYYFLALVPRVGKIKRLISFVTR